jgi:predicted anti-sigma-YlaC factor YlaD
MNARGESSRTPGDHGSSGPSSPGNLGCSPARDLIIPYLDGECSPEESHGVAAHVAVCPTCATRLEVHRRLSAALRSVLAPAHGAAAARTRGFEVRRRIEDLARRRRVALVRMAAALFFATAILWLWSLPAAAPPPEDLLANLDILEEFQEEGVQLDPEIVQALLGMPTGGADSRTDNGQDIGLAEDLLEEDLSPEKL